MMHGMLGDGTVGGMMWGMGLFGLVLLLVGLLAVAALVNTSSSGEPAQSGGRMKPEHVLPYRSPACAGDP